MKIWSSMLNISTKSVASLIASILLSLGLVETASAAALICDVQEVSGVSDEDSEKFGIRNGSTEGTAEEYSIRVEIDGPTRHFTNLDNGAELRMSEESPNSYASGFYLFELEDGQSRFYFQVNKMNFSAGYSGRCKEAGAT
jgi:hypothetical protein